MRVFRHRPQSGFKLSGFTLLELSIVLTIVGLVTAMTLNAGVAVISSARLSATQQKMKLIDDILLQYRTAYNRLPCPGDLTLPPTDASYGLEAGANSTSTIAPGTGACTGTGMVPQANFTASGATDTFASSAEGAIPTATLGVSNDLMYDAWGTRFRYVVDTSMTANGVFSTTPLGCNMGPITVNDINGNARTTAATYALVSHGASSHGGYSKQGVIMSTGNTNTNTLINCHCSSTGATTTSSGVQTTNPATYVQADATNDSTNALNSFDDIVTYKERWQISNPSDKTGACRLMLVVDVGNERVQALTLAGNFVFGIGSGYGTASSYAVGASGSANGQFNFAQNNGIGTDSYGNIYVSNPTNDRIDKFSSTGIYIASFYAQYAGFRGLAIDSNNMIWVNCVGGTLCGGTNGIMEINSSSMSYVATLTTSLPVAYADSLAFDKNGYLWIANQTYDNVLKCSVSGSCTAYGSYGTGASQIQQPAYVFVDSSNNIWIGDSYHNPFIQEFSNSFSYLQGIGSYGNGACQYTAGDNETLDANNNVWVADYAGNRLYEFSNNGATCIKQIGCSGTSICPSNVTTNGSFYKPESIYFTSR